MKKIAILGVSLRTTNNGVRALTSSLYKLLVEANPGAVVTIITAERDNTPQTLMINGNVSSVPCVNFRLSPKAKPDTHLFYILLKTVIWRMCPFKFVRRKIEASNELIRTVREADWIGDISGGDSFSDIYGCFNFFLDFIQKVIVLLLEKPLVLLPQTIGPFKSSWGKAVGVSIIKRARTVICRDRTSFEYTRKLSGHDNLILCPDVAFTLEKYPCVKNIVKPVLPDNSGIIGINVSGLLYLPEVQKKHDFGIKFDYQEFTERVITYFLDLNKPVLIVPHTFNPGNLAAQDFGACAQAIDRLEHPMKNELIHRITEPCNHHEIKHIIGRCNFFIGARMHACIAALSQGIPAVGVAYSRKFQGVFETVGVEKLVLDIKTLDLNNAIDFVKNDYSQKAMFSRILSSSIKKNIDHIRNVFHNLILSE
jgi:polysaccharide pyruvyl transferase WcaK-like protein